MPHPHRNRRAHPDTKGASYEPGPYETKTSRGPVRWMFLFLGGTFFAVGLAGAVLPVLPTTPFMLLALWAFARSSRRLHHRLYAHPTFGPSLRRWHEHGVIPLRTKLTAIAVMAVSFGYLLLFSPASTGVLIASAALMTVGAGVILTRPSTPPRALALACDKAPDETSGRPLS